MDDQHWNTSFGVPFDEMTFLTLQICLTACVGLIAVILSNRILRLSEISMGLLWILYYVIGLIFHFCTLLTLDASSYGFLGTTAIHVYVEGLVCIKVLARLDQTNKWARYWTLYFAITTFTTFSLWQPLSLFMFGSLLALPIDTLTIPAALAYLESTATRRFTYEWYLGVSWLVNGIIVLLIFAQLIWGAKMENNFAGFGILVLQIQYVVMGAFVVAVYGKTGSSSAQHNSTPSAVSDRLTWTMQRGFKVTSLLISGLLVLAVVAPIVFGFIDIGMITSPWCTYLPGTKGCK